MLTTGAVYALFLLLRLEPCRDIRRFFRTIPHRDEADVHLLQQNVDMVTQLVWYQRTIFLVTKHYVARHVCVLDARDCLEVGTHPDLLSEALEGRVV